MKIVSLYLMLVIAWFIAGIPICIIVAVMANAELKNEHTNNEKLAIRIAQIIAIVMAVLSAIYLIK